jgi:hypothetical protein
MLTELRNRGPRDILIGLAGQSNIAGIWYGTTPDRSGGGARGAR